MILLTITGVACSHTQTMVKNKICAVPAPVILKGLDNDTHIGSEKNISILMLNIADMVAYIKKLESSIKCFQGE